MPTSRRELLQLSKKDLIKQCKYVYKVSYKGSKTDIIERIMVKQNRSRIPKSRQKSNKKSLKLKQSSTDFIQSPFQIQTLQIPQFYTPYPQRETQTLSLLICGYLRKILHIHQTYIAPTEIIHEFTKWLRQKLYIEFSKFARGYTSLPLQIRIEGDWLNILKPSDIKHYQINFSSTKNAEFFSMLEFELVQGQDIKINPKKVKKAYTSDIYPYKCVCYSEVRTPSGRFVGFTTVVQ